MQKGFSTEICKNVAGNTTQRLSQTRVPAQNRTGYFPCTRKKRRCLYHSVGFMSEYARGETLRFIKAKCGYTMQRYTTGFSLLRPLFLPSSVLSR